jgi:hypothetical protein
MFVMGCALVLIPSMATNVWAKPDDPAQEEFVPDTFKYLKELDRLYSQITRPR